MDHVPALRLLTGGADEVTPPGQGDQGRVRITLPARAENIAMIRHVIGALAESLLLPDGLVEDIRLAVTEAYTNVVRHAYRNGDQGEIDIAVHPAPGRLEVVVVDHGCGIRPSPSTDGAGLGLPLITALTEDFEIDQPDGGGSVLHMSFRSRSGRFTHA